MGFLLAQGSFYLLTKTLFCLMQHNCIAQSVFPRLLAFVFESFCRRHAIHHQDTPFFSFVFFRFLLGPFTSLSLSASPPPSECGGLDGPPKKRRKSPTHHHQLIGQTCFNAQQNRVFATNTLPSVSLSHPTERADVTGRARARGAGGGGYFPT